MIHDTNDKQEQSAESKDSQETTADFRDNAQQKLEQQVQKCEQELAYWKDQYLRIVADFENFKKRLERERFQTSRIIKSDILLDLLPVVDNFERALKAEHKVDPAAFQGYEMIYKDLSKILKKQGVEEMSLDKTFNPELHEAVMNVASEQHMSGEVVEILEKGYMLNGEVLRPAKVSIAL